MFTKCLRVANPTSGMYYPGGWALDCKKSRIPKRHSCFLRTVPLRNVTNIKLMPYMSLHTTSYLNTARKVSQQTLRVNCISPLKPIIRQYSSNSRAQESPFEYGRRCWDLVEHEKLIWHAAMSHTTFLDIKLRY